MITHVIRVVKVWPVDRNYLPEIYFAMAGLFLLLAVMCGIWCVRRIT